VDKEIRNRIQRATQAVRALLEREYAEQLEGMFDICLDGTIAAEPGGHLDAQQRALRTKLVAAVEHVRSSVVGHQSAAEAVTDYLREAAFTTLNRFVALKMLEARGLVQECISHGEQSAGFKEFTGLAPGLVQLPDHGYRLYIESLFDEIGCEVRVLFDRRDPASLLWPRRQALQQLLDILNDPDLDKLTTKDRRPTTIWHEDETIGWVYQYFNSDEDREKARYDDKGKPKAPQTSYELAVRNQFFTPRYVVEFLTDNTLGRIWYEMRQGKTRLVDECDYLVRRPTEIFLAEGEQAPEESLNSDENLSQEELLKKPVYLPFRARKDPRDLKILDPACGSGHFLLYAFDLLISIYEEASEDDSSPISEVTSRNLRDDYTTLEDLRGALPGLVLRHNLHGIDIDPRAVQIAALALWMRAQRAYNDFGIDRGKRLPIVKTNIVVAEPMPGEKELRDEFIASLDKQLGQLVECVFEKMELAGELGSLLKIEDEIQAAIRDIYGETGELFRKRDEERWRQAETELKWALYNYAEKTQNGRAYRRKLFAEDAARGLGFIDIAHHRFDVILMNPPFGEPSQRTRIALQRATDLASNLYAYFVNHSRDILLTRGLLGIISDSTFLKQPSFLTFRRRMLLEQVPARLLVDLGWGVLDANVRTAMYTCEKAGQLFPDIPLLATSIEEDVGPSSLSNRTRSVQFWCLPIHYLRRLPKAVLAYELDPLAGERLIRMTQLGAYCELPWGIGANDSSMLFRLRWEVPTHEIGTTWQWLTNGGKPSPFYRENYLVCLARLANGDSAFDAEFRSGTDRMYDASAKHLLGTPGLTHPKRTGVIHFSFLPVGHVVTPEGKGVFPRENTPYELSFLCGLLNSSFIGVVASWICGPHKQRGDVKLLPVPSLSEVNQERVRCITVEIAAQVAAIFCTHETSILFSGLALDGLSGPKAVIENRRQEIVRTRRAVRVAIAEIDGIVAPSLPRELQKYARQGPLFDLVEYLWDDMVYEPLDIVSYALGCALGRWSASPVVERLTWDFKSPARSKAPAEGGNNGVGDGIFVDDSGHTSDVIAAVERVFDSLWPGRGQESLRELESLVSDNAIRSGVAVDLFSRHTRTYAEGRRKAPIYWQLATSSASYSVWLYYHRFTKDTFYKVLSDYVTPKLQHEERKLADFIQSAGGSPTASQRKEIAAQEVFVEELRAFREEIARIAPLWNPDLNDGVIINFAPLWRLVPHHRTWQKECKACWDKLVAGDYDWSHLAMHLWPERVVPKCAEDRSPAIAHGLEEVFWVEGDNSKWQPRKVDPATIDQLIKERTSAAVKDALKSLLEAPAPMTKRSTTRAKGTRRKSSPRTSRLAATNGPNPSMPAQGKAANGSVAKTGKPSGAHDDIAGEAHA